MRLRTGLLFGAVFAGVLSFALGLGVGKRPAPPATVPWERDLPSALARAKGERKLVLVDFYTDWCRWCQRLESTTLVDPQVADALRANFVPVRLNAETTGKQEAARLGVDSYPTMVFLDASGREVYRITGYLEPREFLKELESLKVES